MARIWDDIEIEWQGETYTVRPTLSFINHLEQGEGRSISKLFQRTMQQDLPSGAACELIAKTLQYAGAEVDADEVFAETSGGIDATAVTLATQILLACMPRPKDPPPMATDSKKKSAPKRKATGGKSTGSQSVTSE